MLEAPRYYIFLDDQGDLTALPARFTKLNPALVYARASLFYWLPSHQHFPCIRQP